MRRSAPPRRGGGNGGDRPAARRVQSSYTTGTRQVGGNRRTIGRAQSEFAAGGSNTSRRKPVTFNAGSTPRASSRKKRKPKAKAS